MNVKYFQEVVMSIYLSDITPHSFPSDDAISYSVVNQVYLFSLKTPNQVQHVIVP